jgi:predicted dehydrogenase
MDAVKPLRIGLVGTGAWGRNYLRNLAGLGALAAVCDTDERRLAEVRASFPSVAVCSSVAELLAQNLNGAVVATHTPQHYPVAKELLAAGLHCHVEKPLTESVEQALELCELAESQHLVLSAGHILLYHPAVEYIKGMLERGELGEVYYINAVRANLGAIRTHENAMWSLAPHDISVVQYLLGEEPDSVSATGRAFVQAQAGIYDVTHLSIHFPSGKLASVTSSWLDPEKVRQIKVVGSKCMVVFDDMDPRYKLQVHDKGVDWEQFNEASSASALKVRSGDVHIPFVKPTEPLRAECEEFLRCIRTGGTPRTGGRQGLTNVQILAAGQRSLGLNGQPVAI